MLDPSPSMSRLAYSSSGESPASLDVPASSPAAASPQSRDLDQEQEQGLAAFPNDDRSQEVVSVAHYVDHSGSESDPEIPAHVGLSLERTHTSISIRTAERTTDAASPAAGSAASPGFSRDRSTTAHTPNLDDLARLPVASTSPPMLGTDLVFRRCRSPTSARFDVWQGPCKIVDPPVSSPIAAGSAKPNGLWSARSRCSKTARRPAHPFGLAPTAAADGDGPAAASKLNGVVSTATTGQTTTTTIASTTSTAISITCTSITTTQNTSSQASRPLWQPRSANMPPKPPGRPGVQGTDGRAGPCALWTGQTSPATPVLEQENVMSLDFGLAQPTDREGEAEPPSPNLPPSPPSSAKSATRELSTDLNDQFVTQVYNYLSLGYPAVARDFDEELSKVSGIPISELRKDDELIGGGRGYILLEPDGFVDESVSEEQILTGIVKTGRVNRRECRRWRALWAYVADWLGQYGTSDAASNHTGQSEMADPHGGWGVAVRRGSWAG